MSVFIYNDITIPYALISNFSQEAVYDESDTNKLYTKFDITVQGVLNADYASTIGGGAAAAMTGAQLMNQIRARLLTPRKTLQITFGGTNIIPTAQANTTVDSKNGPHPQAVSITQLQTNTFLVQFRIVTHWTETASGPDGAGATGGGTVISNRWTETQSIDFANFSTRTRTGKIIIRSDNPNGSVPDNVRESMAVVGVPIGFLRESSSYTVSTDGLQLDYSVTDKEVFYMPPAPAFRARGKYIETTARNGAMRYGTVSLTLWGDKATKQSALLQTAIQVAASHILQRGPEGGGQNKITKIESSCLEVDMYENVVRVEMRVLMAANGKQQFNKNAGFIANRATQAPRGSTNSTPVPNYQARGTTNMLIQAAAYYDPAVGAKFNQVKGQLVPGNQPGEGA